MGGTLSTYSFIVFTSPSAARFAVGRRAELVRDLAAPGAPAVAAVGAETARALVAQGIAGEAGPRGSAPRGARRRLRLCAGRRAHPLSAGGRRARAPRRSAGGARGGRRRGRGVADGAAGRSRRRRRPSTWPPSPAPRRSVPSWPARRPGCALWMARSWPSSAPPPRRQPARRASRWTWFRATPSVAALVAALVRHRRRRVTTERAASTIVC